MIPFSFQKGNKPTGCEDAPPVADVRYSIVCDGLGGSGLTKHLIKEDKNESSVYQTSSYLGSRIVSTCVNEYYADNFQKLFSDMTEGNQLDIIQGFVLGLKKKIEDSILFHMKKWGIEHSRSRTIKIFPTTLASALYYPCDGKVLVVALWAGDSRVYILSPTKGLQLLSMDDSRNAENEMNSTSEMTNCISAGNSFNINYAVYELTESAMVFCCTDGCFDYLQSPLHFEWLLLHTMLECMPDDEEDHLGKRLAEMICEKMYATIGDDTTMAGMLVHIDSVSQMKNLYQNRMDAFDKSAIDMNTCLQTLKKIQRDRDAASKTCRLNEEKAKVLVQNEVCNTLRKKDTNPILFTRLEKMGCFRKYLQMLDEKNDVIDEEYAKELNKAHEEGQRIKDECRTMILRDYIKWKNLQDNQYVNQNAIMGWISNINSGQKKSSYIYNNPKEIKQVLQTLIEMYKHPEFSKILFRSDYDEDYVLKDTVSQILLLEKMQRLIENGEEDFLSLWSQSYFSTDDYARERYEYNHSRNFEEMFRYAMQYPDRCDFISSLTEKKIRTYYKKGNDLHEIQQQLEKSRRKMLEELPDEFWNSYQDEITKDILSDDEKALYSYFDTGNHSMERLISYVEAKKRLHVIVDEIGEAQRKVDAIWDSYKTDYQLFKKILKKGVC